MRVLQLDFAGRRPHFSVPEECRARHHENGCIHEKRQVQGNDRIDQVVAASLAKALLRRMDPPRLH